MKPLSYTYTVLRYVHDTTTGEFVNVGVALYAPEAKYASALCRTTQGRLSRVFPGMHGEHFKSLMRYIQARFEELGAQLAGELPLASPENVMEIAQTVLPKDDSSLQWSPAGSGRCADPAETLERLFERMVARYDEPAPRKRRTEEDVWRHFKRDLEERRLLHRFEPKTIAVQDDEVEFDYAWKNGVWHCLEPISFDLAEPDSIRDKAHRWLGQMTSVRTSEEQFRLYLLVGQPQHDDLRPAFDSALSILRKIPVEKEIFLEQDTDKLADLIAEEVASHEAALPNE